MFTRESAEICREKSPNYCVKISTTALPPHNKKAVGLILGLWSFCLCGFSPAVSHSPKSIFSKWDVDLVYWLPQETGLHTAFAHHKYQLLLNIKINICSLKIYLTEQILDRNKSFPIQSWCMYMYVSIVFWKTSSPDWRTTAQHVPLFNWERFFVCCKYFFNP